MIEIRVWTLEHNTWTDYASLLPIEGTHLRKNLSSIKMMLKLTTLCKISCL